MKVKVDYGRHSTIEQSDLNQIKQNLINCVTSGEIALWRLKAQLKTISDSNININLNEIYDKDGNGLLVIAASKSNNEAIKILLEAGYDINGKFSDRDLNIRSLEKLNSDGKMLYPHVTNNLKENVTNYVFSKVYAAINIGENEQVAAILNQFRDAISLGVVDLDAMIIFDGMREGETLLHRAFDTFNLEAFQSLLNAGADMNKPAAAFSPQTMLELVKFYKDNPKPFYPSCYQAAQASCHQATQELESLSHYENFLPEALVDIIGGYVISQAPQGIPVSGGAAPSEE